MGRILPDADVNAAMAVTPTVQRIYSRGAPREQRQNDAAPSWLIKLADRKSLGHWEWSCST